VDIADGKWIKKNNMMSVKSPKKQVKAKKIKKNKKKLKKVLTLVKRNAILNKSLGGDRK